MRISVQGGEVFVYSPGGLTERKTEEIKYLLKQAGVLRWRGTVQAWAGKYRDSVLAMLIEVLPSLEPADRSTADLISLVKAKEQRRLQVVERVANVRNNKIVDLTGYEFGQFKPFDYQAVALTALNPNLPLYTPVMPLFADCGTGKTAVAVWWISAWKKLKSVSGKTFKAVVIAPRNTLRRTWLADIEKFSPGLSAVVLTGTLERRRNIIHKTFKADSKNKDYDIYLTSPQGIISRRPGKTSTVPEEELISGRIAGLYRDILSMKPDLIIVDESSMMKNPSSQITQALWQMGDKIGLRMILSGTPAPNGPKEYYSQLRFLSLRTFGASHEAFLDKWFERERVGAMQWVLQKPKRGRFLKRLHQYTMRFRESECLDLPTMTDHIVGVTLDQPMWAAYRKFIKDAVISMCAGAGKPVTGTSWNTRSASQTVAAANGLDKLLKSREITSGFLMYEDATGGKNLAKLHDSKFEALAELLETISISQPEDELEAAQPEQVSIWGWFRYELERIKEMLGDKCALIYGGMNEKVVAELLVDFQSGRYQYLAAHPASLGHGLTLCEQLNGNPYPQCHRQVYYSLGPSLELYHQSRKRYHRVGQKLAVHNYHLLAESPRGGRSVDHVMYDTLRGRYADSADLIDAVLETERDKGTLE